MRINAWFMDVFISRMIYFFSLILLFIIFIISTIALHPYYLYHTNQHLLTGHLQGSLQHSSSSLSSVSNSSLRYHFLFPRHQHDHHFHHHYYTISSFLAINFIIIFIITVILFHFLFPHHQLHRHFHHQCYHSSFHGINFIVIFIISVINEIITLSKRTSSLLPPLFVVGFY